MKQINFEIKEKFEPTIVDLLSCTEQDETINYVKNFFMAYHIPYYEDEYGNLFYIDNKGVPLLSAHMDTVAKEKDKYLGKTLIIDENNNISSGGIIGGDDKCGVYIILKILQLGYKVNFILSKDEETGCVGINTLNTENPEEMKKISENCLFCLVLDRKGDRDIICENNCYGTKEFEDKLFEISNQFNAGYKPATGLFSDADTICDYISTANLSVGYYNPHSEKEYVNIDCLNIALEYVKTIIENVTDRFEKTDEVKWGRYYNYGSYKNKKGSGYSGYYGYGGYYDDVDELFGDWDGYYDKYWKDDKKNKNTSSLKTKVRVLKDFKQCDVCGEKDWVYEIFLNSGKTLNICPSCALELEDKLNECQEYSQDYWGNYD